MIIAIKQDRKSANILMDTLQELPLEQWPILQNKLKQLWPINVPGYYTLKMNLKYPKLREAFQFKVYCPHGDVDNGFVGINVKVTRGLFNEKIQPVFLPPFHADMTFFEARKISYYLLRQKTRKLEEAVTKTKLIDWTKRVCIDLVTSMMLKSVERIRDVMEFKEYNVGTAKMYLLEGITKPFTDLRLPDNTYIGPVKHEHITRVDDTWPYKHSASHFYFTTLASNGLSYGLYSCNHELLAWLFINEYNFLCHLYCEERYRCKGCAEYVMKWAVNEQLRDGNDIYAYVVEGNEKPLALLRKLGFKAFDDSAFLYVEL